MNFQKINYRCIWRIWLLKLEDKYCNNIRKRLRISEELKVILKEDYEGRWTVRGATVA
jgi:hypothetical protein